MKHLAPSVHLAVGVALCVAAGSSWALSVGRAQGAALIGRPLEVSVPVNFDPATEAAPECAAVEVFYGDNRIGADRVSTEIQSTRSSSTVRVRATVPVNEPVVTVYLHVGCQGRLTRRVVMLAEHADTAADAAAQAVAPPAMVQAAPLPAPAAAASAPARRTRSAATAAAAPSTSPAAPPASAPAGASVARAPGAPAPAPRAAETPRRPRPVASPTPAARGTARDRLRLDDLDLAAPASPVLRLSTDMAAPGEAPQQQRALAGALWRALNASPEDLLRETQRLESLERDLRGLRASVQRNDAALATLKVELERARAQRWANPLVYALAALALAAVIAAVLAWRRMRAGEREHWWRSAGVGEDELGDLLRTPSAPASQPSAAAAAGTDRPPSAAADSRPGPRLAESLPGIQVPEAPPPTPQHSIGFGDSILGPRSLRAEEVRDVQQEADFFVSLGEHERAVEVLRNHIAANPDTSAVAWLDLLEILHRTGQRQEFEWLREDFQRTFNARVPAFDAYNEGAGAGLEAYEEAMSRICALWPSRKVLDIIEDSIFRPPGLGSEPPFSLAAYRDLLMLHHLGQEVMGGPSSGAIPLTPPLPEVPDFSHTTLRSLSTAGVAAPAAAEADSPLTAAGAYSEHDLDLNLDEPASQPDVLIGGPGADDNLLDFDLPDIDTSAMRPKKTRE